MSTSAHQRASLAVRDHRMDIASEAIRRQFAGSPALAARHGGAENLRKSIEDAAHHLSHLCESLFYGKPGIFEEYASWAASVLAARGIEPGVLQEHLLVLAEVLAGVLQGEQHELAAAHLQRGADAVRGARLAQPAQVPGVAHPAVRKLVRALLHGGKAEALSILDALRAGAGGWEEVARVVRLAMEEVGRLWQLNEIGATDEHHCTRVLEVALARSFDLRPAPPSTRPVVVSTCPSGEMHDLGIRLVADAFERAGWRSILLGANSPAMPLLATLAASRADVLALSVSFVPNLAELRSTISAVRALPELRSVKILVGGRPFARFPELAQPSGADAVASGPAFAVSVAASLLECLLILPGPC